MKVWGLVCGMLCLYQSIYGNALIQSAENLYKNGQFEESSTAYLQLYNQAPNHVGVLFNLGNTFFKQGKLGYAIAYYQKALQWEPADSDIRYNLQRTRSFVDKQNTEQQTVLQQFFFWTTYISLNTAYYICIVFFIALLITVYLKKKRHKKSEIFYNGGVVLTALFLVSLLLFVFKVYDTQYTKGVVINKKSAVYSGPSNTLSVLFYVYDGYECKVKQQQHMWTEIELSNGFKGWVQSADIFFL